MRKIEPLRAKLATLGAWITAIRRDQTPDRAQSQKIEWDAKFGLVKINPLVDWTSDMVWDYVRKHRLPYNSLHDEGYPSIGCAPCTRPVEIGEDPRAGRWSGSAKTECGLHQRSPVAVLPVLRD
jgi:phosphoadenosine phosphosulfate reductase